MALEFTHIPDRNAPAVYIFGDGTLETEQSLKQFGEKLDELTPKDTRVVYLNPNDGDGPSIVELYGLSQFPSVMIVMKDETIEQQWDQNIPEPDEIAYALNQITGDVRGF